MRNLQLLEHVWSFSLGCEFWYPAVCQRLLLPLLWVILLGFASALYQEESWTPYKSRDQSSERKGLEIIDKMGEKKSWEHLGKQNAFLFSWLQSERSTISFSQTILWHPHYLQNKETEQRRHVKSWKSINGMCSCCSKKSSDTISIKNFFISQRKSRN